MPQATNSEHAGPRKSVSAESGPKPSRRGQRKGKDSTPTPTRSARPTTGRIPLPTVGLNEEVLWAWYIVNGEPAQARRWLDSTIPTGVEASGLLAVAQMERAQPPGAEATFAGRVLDIQADIMRLIGDVFETESDRSAIEQLSTRLVERMRRTLREDLRELLLELVELEKQRPF